MTTLISRRQALAGSLLMLSALAGRPARAEAGKASLKATVDATIGSLMREHGVPGMAVAITHGGERTFFNYGVASRENGQKVGEDTLFELGSVSKTFTGILAAHAQVRAALAFSDKASHHWPALAGTSFDDISLLQLGTYTAGGLPLQFPSEVTDEASMTAYFQRWRTAFTPGSHRLYSNPSIGLFGFLAARSLNQPFDAVMEGTILPGLGLARTYIKVPPQEMDRYAYGYGRAGRPMRVGPGMLDSQAYGVKSSASDMIRYIETIMDGSRLDDTMRQAVIATVSGYDKVGGMVQGLGWEMYPYPVGLDSLLAGNSDKMSRRPNPVTPLVPPLAPGQTMLLNKTGSTAGFGAYAAFVPRRRVGIAMLANRNYPNAARVSAAYRILAALEKQER